jgi:hypothetical protein
MYLPEYPMAVDFETFAICLLGLAGIASFFRHRRRQHEYAVRLGANTRAIPARSSRTTMLLFALSVAAAAGITIGIVELSTATGINSILGLFAIVGSGSFFITTYRESITLIGPNGFAIPYFNLYLPWSAIEEVAWDSPAGSRTCRLSLHYRRPGGIEVLHLNVKRDAVISTSAMLQELRSPHGDEPLGDNAPGMIATANSTQTFLN